MQKRINYIIGIVYVLLLLKFKIYTIPIFTKSYQILRNNNLPMQINIKLLYSYNCSGP